MKKYIKIIICLLFMSNNILAQKNTTSKNSVVKEQKILPFVNGSHFIIHSKILNENREIHMYLPQNYDKSNKKYPVLYVLDGENEFHQITGIVGELSSGGRIQEMIVVGIPNFSPRLHRMRDFGRSPNKLLEKYASLGLKADNFIAFLEEELITHINQNFRTNNFRILSGKSLSGNFTVDLLLRKPDLFEAYIASSPVIGSNDDLAYRKAKALFSKQKSFNKFLYLSMANESLGNYELIQRPMAKLVKLLEENASSDFNWSYRHFPEENHSTIGLITNYYALVKLYESWRPPSFSSIKDFKDRGGINFIKENYKKSKIFGLKVTENLPQRHIMSLASVYRKERKFKELKQFILNEPGVNTEVLRKIGEWFLHWPAGYEKEAISYFEIWAKRYPKSYIPLLAISHSYFILKQKEESDKYQQKALSLHKENPDSDFKDWQDRYSVSN